MSKRLKYKKNSKFISRFRVKNISTYYPELHQPPLNTYFDRVDFDKSVLGQTNKSKFMNEALQRSTQKFRTRTQNQNLQFCINSSVVESKEITSSENVSIFNQTRVSKMVSDQAKSIKKPRKQSIFDQTFEKQQQKKKDAKKQHEDLYLNYFQYEKILQSGQVRGSFMQKMAKKNDKKLKTENKLISISPQMQRKTFQKEKFNPRKYEKLDQPLPNPHKRRNRTDIQRKQTYKPSLTIISSNIGALANGTILQKLQLKWQQEQNKRTQVNQPSQDSQLSSQRETKGLTIKESINLWNQNKKKQDKNVGEKKVDLEMIPQQKYRDNLRRILQLDSNMQKKEKRTLSQGQEYSSYQRTMMRFQDVYKSRKNQLRHKFDWKF